MTDALVFAGTKEGRILAEYLCSNLGKVAASVATEYGEEILNRRKQDLQPH